MIPTAALGAGILAGQCLMLPGLNNADSKIKNRNREIANLKTENAALRDQLEQAQNQQGCSTPWSNLMQFPQLNFSYQQQQPTNQLLNTASQLMQQMSQGMATSPQYGGMFGQQTGSLANTTGTVQNLFGQLQNLMQLSGGLYNAMQAYQGLQQQQSFPNPLNQGGMQPQGWVQNPVPSFGQPMPPMYSQPAMCQPVPPMYSQPVPSTYGQPAALPTYGQPGIPTFAQPDNERAIITTLGKNASKLFKGGKTIDKSTIMQIAQGGRCPDGSLAPPDLKMACMALSQNQPLFDKLQSALKATKGKVDTDGKATVQDLQTLMAQLKETTPMASTTFNTNAPVQPYSPNSAYASSFVNALMGHLNANPTGVNPYLLSLMQQPGMQQPANVQQPRLAA